MVITPRSHAIDLLCHWQNNGQSIDQIQDKYDCTFTDPRDKQLCSALLFGVLRNLTVLDWHLEQFSSHPLSKMKPLTLMALRVGLFQLFFLDRIPASAALNETIQVLKEKKQPKWLCGFVNGLLRNVHRSQKAGTLRQPPPEAKLNHPGWLIKRWKNRYGQQVSQEICHLNNKPAPLCLWVNQQRLSCAQFTSLLHEQDIISQPSPFSPTSIQLPNYRGAITRLPGFEKGYFQVQDDIAQLIPGLMLDKGQGSFLDACAGLGGKTISLAATLNESNGLVAVEPQKRRFGLLMENIKRMGFTKKITPFLGTLNDYFRKTQSRFAGILVDAPCSGTGVIGRHPDIRWNRKSHDLLEFQKKQLTILTDAALLLEPNGVLIYATCSIEPEENEQVVHLFLEQNPTFQLENVSRFLPETAQELVDSRGFLHTIPNAQCSDGFFAARFICS